MKIILLGFRRDVVVCVKFLYAFEVPVCMVFFEYVLRKILYRDCILIVVFFVGPLFVSGVVIASNLFWSACAFCLDPRSVCIVGICAVILWLDSVLGF